MKKRSSISILGVFGIVLAFSLAFTGCGSAAPAVQNQASQPKGETQMDKFQRILVADNEKLEVVDGKAATSSIEQVLQPQSISSIEEITSAKLVEPGRPYYFKIRALYKGYDADAEKARLQDIGEVKSSSFNSALETIFAGDTNVYSVDYFDFIVETFPKAANTVATFYLVAGRFNQDKNGKPMSEESLIMIRFVRDAGKPSFNAANFVVANGMHFITVADAHVPSQQDAMMALMGLGSMNSSSSVFDPAVYPLTDLLDARVAMDKKKWGNDYTFPTVRVKYVSEVVFKGQSGTTITVSTPDGISTERMNFGGRAAGITNGAKIRAYYTIAKDPYEIWEVQALERL